jgi:osmotically inducible lipoprotein OsmB
MHMNNRLSPFLGWAGRVAFGVALASSLAACGSMSERDRNTAVGAGVGAVAGSVLTGGSTTGTVGGAVVGGVVGNQVDKDRQR